MAGEKKLVKEGEGRCADILTLCNGHKEIPKEAFRPGKSSSAGEPRDRLELEASARRCRACAVGLLRKLPKHRLPQLPGQPGAAPKCHAFEPGGPAGWPYFKKKEKRNLKLMAIEHI